MKVGLLQSLVKEVQTALDTGKSIIYYLDVQGLLLSIGIKTAKRIHHHNDYVQFWHQVKPPPPVQKSSFHCSKVPDEFCSIKEMKDPIMVPWPETNFPSGIRLPAKQTQHPGIQLL